VGTVASRQALCLLVPLAVVLSSVTWENAVAQRLIGCPPSRVHTSPARQVVLLASALKKLFQNMQVADLLAQTDLLPSLSLGLQHPGDGVREVAAVTLRRLLLNLPPAYIEITTLPSVTPTRAADAARSQAVANAAVSTEGLVQNVALCVADSRILVAERACEILVLLAAASTVPDTKAAIARAVAHTAGTAGRH
jgi:hypothetical protein